MLNNLKIVAIIASAFGLGVAIEQTKIINHLWTAWYWFPPTAKLAVIALVVMCAVLVMAYCFFNGKK